MSAADAVAALEKCNEAMSGLDRADLGLLLDWRLPTLVSDPSILKHIVRNTDRLAAEFFRLAILVKTPLGQLQIARLERSESCSTPAIFSDEAAAIEYVSREADAPPSSLSSFPPSRPPSWED